MSIPYKAKMCRMCWCPCPHTTLLRDDTLRLTAIGHRTRCLSAVTASVFQFCKPIVKGLILQTHWPYAGHATSSDCCCSNTNCITVLLHMCYVYWCTTLHGVCVASGVGIVFCLTFCCCMGRGEIRLNSNL